MNLSKEIQKILNIPPDIYEIRLFRRYANWCATFENGSPDDLQKLLANTAINKWFLNRYAELEQRAYNILYKEHQAMPATEVQRMYEAVMVDIFTTYPKPLFEAARKLSVINNLN